jgi:prepilin-type N-terminal cleavage/methylation domain-containing protein
MKHLKLSDQCGFTIVELMISTVVFSMVLLICTTGLLQISRSYYRGVVSSRTQETTRSILEDVSEAIRLGGGTVEPRLRVTPGGPVQGACAGGKRYSYELNKQLDDTVASKRHVLLADEMAVCSSATPAQDVNAFAILGREMMSNRMRLVDFSICAPGDAPADCPTGAPPATSSLYKVTIRVAAGDDDLLADSDGDGKVECRIQRSGGQFCAVSELSTTVQKRL